MYMVIRIIVHAVDEENALKKAKKALNELTKGHQPFDYYKTFDSPNCDEEIPAVVLASSPAGKRLIEEGWQETHKEFLYAFEKVKLAIEHLTPEQIMEETAPDDLPQEVINKISRCIIRLYFHYVSGLPGFPNFLYHDHDTIACKRHLERALRPIDGMNAYVIPAYVHY